MRSRATLFAFLTVLIAAGVALYAYRDHESDGALPAPLATPPGVTLHTQVDQRPSAFVILNLYVNRTAFRFGGPDGTTAYVTDKDDQPGKSSCEGDCAKAWPPVLVPSGATAFGDWSIVVRSDGARQWAYRGRPLYTSKKDPGWGFKKGNGVDGVWSVAVPVWNSGSALPPEFAIAEVAEAQGQALVDDRGMVLYTFGGDVDRDQAHCAASACDHRFVPYAAPQAALPAGDFTIIERTDGIRQWRYKGRPLYTYDGDVLLGDANGKDVDRRYGIALLARYYVPAEVKLRPDEKRGGVWTTQDGFTLYVREVYRYTASGAHSARGGEIGIPQLGIAVGLLGCDDECEKTRPPLKAPPDVQPSGYWTVIKRLDGTNQWAYQGYALYRYLGDKAPGAMASADEYDVLRVDGPILRAALDPYGPGLYWRVANP